MLDQSRLFFIITPPAFAELALSELKEKFPDIPEKDKQLVSNAGIEVRLPLSIGLRLNLYLKIPTRILLRLNDTPSKVRDFPRLYQKISQMADLRHYLRQDLPELKISTHQSRLIHSGRIAETVKAALKTQMKAYPATKHPDGLSTRSPDLYLRLQNDDLTISVDTSGDSLYKRGLKTKVSQAPLRENLAAGLLSIVRKQGELSASSLPVFLIDPMAGQGTFLLEDAAFSLPNPFRSYAFEDFPCMKAQLTKYKQWKEKEKKNFNLSHHHAWAMDLSPQNIAGILELKEQTKAEHWQVAVRDFFSSEKSLKIDSPALVMMNPPYGIRLQVENERNMAEYYNHLIEQSKINFPKAIAQAMIVPCQYSAAILKRKKTRSLLTFSNGGINCVLLFTSYH